ncbi:DUF4180 domain-containing protein [Spirosoma koreense]
MNVELQHLNGTIVAQLVSNDVIINDAQDALDFLANCAYQGATTIIIDRHNLAPDFFELRTGLAGEILQKFSTYDMKLTIVGDYSTVTSKSLRDFIYESNKMGRIRFVDSIGEAKRMV